ncbi:MAG: hypothetical protein RIB47_06990 [Cyclobacteriaceae bacterium]
MKTFIKKTIIGGLLFLIPISVVIVLLHKVFGFMLRIADLLYGIVPIENILGIGTANIIAILLILLICFLFGLLASNKNIAGFKNTLETNVLMKIPGYLFIKAYTEGLEDDKRGRNELEPILVIFDDNAQLGFLIEENKKGLSSVFMPGSPNPWSGNVVYVEMDRIKQLKITTHEAIKHLQQVGKNSAFVNGINI